jgi:hypothetical protein
METKYKIESGVQMSEACGRPRRTYPFAEMNVGDSFAVAARDLKKVQSSASWYGRSHNKKYSVHCIDPVEGKYRCWRIA